MSVNDKFVSNTTTAKPKVHFQFIDGLRGIAAFWVLLFHTDPDGRISQLTSALPTLLVDVLFRLGSRGVAIFFVLSGFVMAYSLRNAKIDLNYFKNFLIRRFVRLSPPYYASILIALAFAFVASVAKGVAFEPMGQPLSFQRFFAHLFYVQDIFKLVHIDDVYWTLCLEVQFYLVFFFLLSLVKWLDFSLELSWSRAAVFVPATLLAALYPVGAFAVDGRPTIIFPFLYSFFLGVFAYWTWRENLKSLWFYLYCGVLLTAGIINSSGFAITSVIVAILILEVARANRMQDWLNWGWLQFLGKISYSLYLNHVSIIGATYFLGYKLLGRNIWSEFVCLLLGISTSIAFATLMWNLVEKPSMKWTKNIKIVNSSKAVGT
ncbi:MAG: acyltransferase [Cyanobacteria bacterium P01_D01_bin.50]